MSSFQEPQTATMKIHECTRTPFEIQDLRTKPTEFSSTIRGELDPTSRKLCNSESFRFTELRILSML